MSRIAILGPGLLGGSIALKLRTLGTCTTALWARRSEAIYEIQQRQCADEASTDLASIVHGAEIVILCTPVATMPALATAILPHLAPSAIVTDVGSVKANVCTTLGSILGVRFIGSHPMAGSQFTGLSAAREDLFHGTTCILTPDAITEPAPLAKLHHFWHSLGCRTVQMTPAAHDESVALISHLPHLVAGALVAAVAAKNPTAFEVAGPGFRDTTRVASGSPELWIGILEANASAVVPALDAMIAKLGELRHMLAPFAADALRNHLAAAKETRDRITFPQ